MLIRMDDKKHSRFLFLYIHILNISNLEITNELAFVIAFHFSFSRMSPTEFSNYIKQRAMQQQVHHSHNNHNNMNTPNATATNGHINPIGPVSPARSLSPSPLSIAIMNGGTSSVNNLSTRNRSNHHHGAANNYENHNYDGHNYMNSAMYSPPYARNNLYDTTNPYAVTATTPAIPNNTNQMTTNPSFYSNGWNGSIGNAVNSKYSPYIDTSNYYGLPNSQQQQQSTTINSIGSPSSHINGMTNGHHQTLESNLNAGNINLLVAN